MIVSFSVSNFRSFHAEETFSLVASHRLTASHDDHALPIPHSKEKVLRTAVIYGANGAGKSNLLRSLKYLKSVALQARKKNSGTGREIFRFGEGAGEPSSFDIQFIAEQKVYRFGFKVDDHRIVEEWLVEVVGGREKALYERITGSDGKVTIEAQGLKTAGEKMSALATVGGPQNQSFLATINVTLDASDIGDSVRAVLAWFKESLQVLGPGESFGPLGQLLAQDPVLAEFASGYLKASSTGVDHLEVLKRPISEEELRAMLPEGLAPVILKFRDDDENGHTVFRLADGNELLIERGNSNRCFHLTIRAAHTGDSEKIIPLDLSEESDGTRRLLGLIPALHALQSATAVYFIDELDRSLHPALALKFLEYFLRSSPTGQRQMIVTTHESNLLDLDLLRRDEIWFAEKDDKSATRLYSLVDFKVRNDLEIRKHYLQGRFGAVPFLGNFDRLLPEKEPVG